MAIGFCVSRRRRHGAAPFQGYFQPKLNDGKTFNDFMISHRKSEGMDLWDTDVRVGKAALLNAISRDVSDDEPAKQSWMMHVGKF